MSERLPFYYRITSGIRITVRPSFLKERSNPLLGQFVFAYHIRIENVGEQGRAVAYAPLAYPRRGRR